MRIVTLNTCKGAGAYRQRLQCMVQGQAALAPDAVLLQEALVTEDGQADTADHLARALGMHLVAGRCGAWGLCCAGSARGWPDRGGQRPRGRGGRPAG